MTTPTTDFHSSESDNHVDAVSRIHSVDQRTRVAARGWARRCLVAFAGLLGLLAILITLAPLTGWEVVRLATGSMAPTYPTDSLLVAHVEAAADARVGDVVMVIRHNHKPVTHRVVSVAASQLPGASQLVLKGDANRTEDAIAYDVAKVAVVVAGVPVGGQLVTFIRSPYVLGIFTLFATVLVLRAWWPRSTGRSRSKHSATQTSAGVPA